MVRSNKKYPAPNVQDILIYDPSAKKTSLSLIAFAKYYPDNDKNKNGA
jgi:hypothetical protein